MEILRNIGDEENHLEIRQITETEAHKEGAEPKIRKPSATANCKNNEITLR